MCRFGGPRGAGGFGGRGGFGGSSTRGGFQNANRGAKQSELGDKLRKPHWDLSRLQPFQKNFYQEHPRASMRREVCGTTYNYHVQIIFFVI